VKASGTLFLASCIKTSILDVRKKVRDN
jgi:hypothetical protein